jgi:hypothetical protein
MFVTSMCPVFYVDRAVGIGPDVILAFEGFEGLGS